LTTFVLRVCGAGPQDSACHTSIGTFTAGPSSLIIAHLGTVFARSAGPGPLALLGSATSMTYRGYAEAKDWKEADFASCSAELSSYFAAELARHSISFGAARIFELGFGNGSFLRFARDNGADIVGIEVQDELLSRASEKNFTVYHSIEEARASEAGHSFDLVVAFDVFEHLEPAELIEMLHEARSLLKTGTGRLLARFPNGDSPFSLPFQNGDFTHRTVLGAGKIEQILAQCGWQSIFLGEPVWTATTLGRRFQNAVRNGLRHSLERLLIYLYYGRVGPATLYYNYILIAAPAAGADRASTGTNAAQVSGRTRKEAVAGHGPLNPVRRVQSLRMYSGSILPRTA